MPEIGLKCGVLLEAFILVITGLKIGLVIWCWIILSRNGEVTLSIWLLFFYNRWDLKSLTTKRSSFSFFDRFLILWTGFKFRWQDTLLQLHTSSILTSYFSKFFRSIFLTVLYNRWIDSALLIVFISGNNYYPYVKSSGRLCSTEENLRFYLTLRMHGSVYNRTFGNSACYFISIFISFPRKVISCLFSNSFFSYYNFLTALLRFCMRISRTSELNFLLSWKRDFLFFSKSKFFYIPYS